MGTSNHVPECGKLRKEHGVHARALGCVTRHTQLLDCVFGACVFVRA